MSLRRNLKLESEGESLRVGGREFQSEQAEGTKEFGKDDVQKCGMTRLDG